ncbi:MULTISPECIES: bifunctional riboflavin kinase/FAD synthetase [Spirosoma]|uniref:Riboflavin biosynthesis protein n=1 Tax=Spirosoma liriopis TaxID=2937440 RepID=A0ABT0HMJ3_9BACT|nr:MULTISPECIES: bifunctional riboflavin kinase/FAD synthetase [Spirosoma]MCK8493395.1 bifunctional riboflavin kinase/FAD synthetase [Spirosoma liriopis]UHG92779.1 bifunctional riboflavin kinase/FAD synthetase [Spirosoma oryzicola]
MIVHRGLDDIAPLPNAVVTSGTFDGVHRGHQTILARLTEVAQNSDGESVLITYWPHPRTVVSNDSQDLKLLTTLDEKIELIEQAGVDHLVVIPFTRSFSELTSEQYIRQILIEKIGTKKLVIGYDHRFGRDREGGFDYIRAHQSEYGFEVEEIPRQDVEAVGVSSSKIRAALQEGNVHTANLFLGRQYSLTGTIIKGQQLGRTIGFPTANLQVDDPVKLVPANGVYAVDVLHDEQVHGGMLNIGFRPTVAGTHQTIETYIFDFDKDIYGEHMTLRFREFLRPEQKFDGLPALVAQLKKDEQTARALLTQ